MNIDLSNIKLVATDCDGVLTDGGMYYTEQGDVMKKFNVIEGVGFERLRACGIQTAIITAEKNPLLQKRADKLKIEYLCMGSKDKVGSLKKICDQLRISLKEAAYIGDDLFDVPAIKACGFGCAPESAFENIKNEADYVTKRKGGEGAFREVAEMIIDHLEFGEN